MKEIWKEIEGVEDYYEVSNFGNIRSLDREVNNGKVIYIKKGKIIKPGKLKNALTVGFNFDGIKVKRMIHRLVYHHFKEKIDESVDIRHKDGNYRNNNVNNLFIQTKNKTPRKFSSVCQYSKDGNLIKVFNTITEAELETGIPHSVISKCCRVGGYIYARYKLDKYKYKYKIKNNIAGGYIWKYL